MAFEQDKIKGKPSGIWRTRGDQPPTYRPLHPATQWMWVTDGETALPPHSTRMPHVSDTLLPFPADHAIGYVYRPVVTPGGEEAPQAFPVSKPNPKYLVPVTLTPDNSIQVTSGDIISPTIRDVSGLG